MLGFNDSTRRELEACFGTVGLDLTGGSFSSVTSVLPEASSVLLGSLLAGEVILVIAVGTCSSVCDLSMAMHSWQLRNP